MNYCNVDMIMKEEHAQDIRNNHDFSESICLEKKKLAQDIPLKFFENGSKI